MEGLTCLSLLLLKRMIEVNESDNSLLLNDLTDAATNSVLARGVYI